MLCILVQAMINITKEKVGLSYKTNIIRDKCGDLQFDDVKYYN